MKYRKTKRWRYKLTSDVTGRLAKGMPDFEIDGYATCIDGLLTIKAGYAWDGATGPVFQTKTNKLSSLVHDVLLQAIDMRLISKSYTNLADLTYLKIAIEQRMFKPRAYLHYFSMRYLRPLIWDKLPKSNYEKVYKI